MKFLFTQPTNLSAKFERKFGVVLDSVRSKGKGGGKGGVATVPKEVSVFAVSKDELDSALANLKTLDFSGSVSIKIDEKLRLRTMEVESSHDVIIQRRGPDLSILGSKANVAKAQVKIDDMVKDEGKEVKFDVDIGEAKLKSCQDQMYEWRKTFSTVQLRIFTADKNPKLSVVGKTEKDVGAAIRTVEEFLKRTACETCTASETSIKRLFDNEKILSKNPWLSISKSFAELKAKHGYDVYITKASDRVQIVGGKKIVDDLKKQIDELLTMACHEAYMRELKFAEVTRIFARDGNAVAKEIMKKTGADINVDRAGDQLVILGDSQQIAKANSTIDKLLDDEGTIEEMLCSKSANRALKSKGGKKIKAVETQHKVTVTVKEDSMTLIGGKGGVEKAQKDLEKFMAEADELEQASTTETIDVDEEDIPRIIGKQGANVTHIRDTANVQIKVERETCSVNIRGLPDGIEEAKRMIASILNKGSDGPAAPVAPKPVAAKVKAKPKEFIQSQDDFPDLGMGPSSKKVKKPAGHWGKRVEAEDAKEQEEEPEQFPTLATKTAAPQEEEEEAGDFDDPFAMMGGMGAEVVYEVKLLKDGGAEKAPEEEEEEAGDFDDPFAMMGGMGAEVVYEVKLLTEKAPEEVEEQEAGMGAEVADEVKLLKDGEAEKAPEEEEEEEAGDFDDPFAMMGGMGGEVFGEVKLTKERSDDED